MSSRLSRGRSTPAMRAMVLLALPLLVTGVRADDEDLPAPADHPALVAHLLHRRMNLHHTLLLVPVDHSAARQIVRRELHQDPISGEDPDVVHPHLPRDVSQD